MTSLTGPILVQVQQSSVSGDRFVDWVWEMGLPRELPRLLFGRSVCHLERFSGGTETVLRGFWDRGRVCGDRSVYVTSHRPAHSSRAHVFSLDRILHFAFEVISVCMALRVYF